MDMRHPLDGVSAKIARAKKHLGDLERDLQVREGHDYGVLTYQDPKTGDVFIYACAPYKLRVGWGIIVGDAVHNLRSALDLLIGQLVIANGATPNRKTAFPIYDNLSKYREYKGAEKIVGVRDDAITIIEGLQPKTADDPLLVLARLDDDDKHNLVHISAATATMDPLGIVEASHGVTVRMITQQAVIGSIEDGADMFEIDLVPQASVNMEASAKMLVTFEVAGPGRGKEVLPTLTGLIDYVENTVVPLFGLDNAATARRHWRPPQSRSVLGKPDASPQIVAHLPRIIRKPPDPGVA